MPSSVHHPFEHGDWGFSVVSRPRRRGTLRAAAAGERATRDRASRSEASRDQARAREAEGSGPADGDQSRRDQSALPRLWRPVRALPAWLLAGLVSSGIWAVLHFGSHWFDQLDLVVYRMGAQALLDGSGVYDAVEPGSGLPFTYPPFAAAVMVPLLWLGQPAAGALVGVASCLALARIAHLCATRIAPLPRLRPAAATWIIVGLGLLSEPVQSTLGYGQVNLLLTWLVLEDLTRAPSRGSGIGTGIATAVKLVPGVFMLWAWLVGERSTALRGAAVFLAAGALTAVGFWQDSWRFWSGTFLDPGHVGGIPYQGNQSVLGVTSRLLGTAQPPGWVTLVAAAVLAASLALAVAVARQGERTRSLVIAGLGGLLASPISWSHHWIWWIPTTCLLAADTAARRPGARWLLLSGLLIFLCRPLWWPSAVNDAALRFGALDQLATASYVLWACAVLAWHARLAALARRSEPESLDGAPTGRQGTGLAGLDVIMDIPRTPQC